MPELSDAKCAVCGNPADWLCDAVIGFKGQKHPRPHLVGVEPTYDFLIDGDLEAYTCDAPLCSRHTRKVPIFDFPEPGINYNDHCPCHEHLHPLACYAEPITEQEAGVRRAEVLDKLGRMAVFHAR